MRWWMALVVAVLLAPVSQALDVAVPGVRARPSSEYDSAWGLGYHGCGVTIAVFDEGIDDSHPYLRGKVVAGYDTTITGQMWTLANGGNPQPLSGVHGTPVAGIAASHAGKMFTRPQDAPAWADDDLVGAAPCAWLVDVMFHDLEGASDDDFVAAFDWAIQHKDNDWGDEDPSNDGIDVITMSWSPYDETRGDDPVSRAANRAVASGIVVLGSVGNSGSQKKPGIGSPAGADGAIGVANLQNGGTISRLDDRIDESSTWGPRTSDGDADPYEELKPDIAAPGTGVWTTGPSLADGTDYQVLCLKETFVLGYGCQTRFGGTSAATPMVAGIVALLLEANPGLEPRDIKEILRQTAEVQNGVLPSSPALNAKWNHQYGFGMVDAHAAVTLALAWPGFDAGRDRDGDGIPDDNDLGPTDPEDRRMRKMPATEASTTTSPPSTSPAPAESSVQTQPSENSTVQPAPAPEHAPAPEPSPAAALDARQAPSRASPGMEGAAALLVVAALGQAIRHRRHRSGRQ